MPVRLSKDWRRTVRTVARLELEKTYPEFQFFFDAYPATQRKAVREIQRRMLRELQRPASGQAAFSSKRGYVEPRTTGELIVALSNFVARQQAQERK